MPAVEVNIFSKNKDDDGVIKKAFVIQGLNHRQKSVVFRDESNVFK